MTLKLIRNVIIDIEGTTTPISFVHDVMFPYVRKNLRQYLSENWSQQQTIDDVKALVSEEPNLPESIPKITSAKSIEIEDVYNNVIAQMDIDRKSTALKQLQGHMWRAAFEQKQIYGAVYEDVVRTLDRLQKQHKVPVYIYSSGSIEAQKLLFGHSDKGDLLSLLSGHFDTTIGSKLESESYKRILESIKCSDASDALFITDSQREALAATNVGLNVLLSIRPGNPPLDSQYKTDNIPQITSFDQIFDKFNFS